jgi:MFS family permease
MFAAIAAAVRRRMIATPAGTVLSLPGFPLVWLANTGGSFALNFWFIATSWLVFELTDSQLWVGLVGSSAAISGIALSLIGGAVTDRMQRRRVIWIALLLFAVCSGIAGLLDATDRIGALHLVALAMAIGAIDTFSNPAYRTLVVELVGTSRLLGANALGQIGEFVGEVIAPLIVGLVITVRGPGAAYFIGAGILICASVAMVASARTARAPAASVSDPGGATGQDAVFDAARPTAGIVADIREGFRYAAHAPSVMPLLAMSAAGMFGSMVFPLLPAYARDELGVGPAGFGVMGAAIATGMAGGAIVIATIRRMPQGGWAILLSHLLIYGSMAGFALSREYLLSIVLLFLTGLGMAMAGALVLTTLQTRVDDRVLGRVMSLFRVTESFEPLGAIVGGGVAAFVGNTEAVLIGACTGTATILFLFARSKALRAL